MIQPIHVIKKETRTLGLDTCNPSLTIGVVMRGGLYLDGVVSFPHDPKNASSLLARRIIEMPYFPELRAVMLHTSSDEPNIALVERITNLPMMAISEAKPRHSRGYKAFDGNPGRLWAKTRLESTILKKILAASWTIGKLPEALRVAHLLARLDLPEKSLG